MSNKVRYYIYLHGCDANTEMFMDLTKEEAALIEQLMDKSNEISTYDCMPTLEIQLAEQQPKSVNNE